MKPSFIPIALKHIHARAKDRPPGYVEDMLAHGTVRDGYLILDAVTHQRLVHKYNPTLVHKDKDCPHCNGQTGNFIPSLPDEGKKRETLREFRVRFLGPLEQVPSNILHVRMAMDQAKAELVTTGCSGCQVSALISEYVGRAWGVYQRSLKANQ